MTYHEKIKYLKSYKLKKDKLIFIDNLIEGVKGIKYEESTGYGHTDIHKLLDEKEEIINELFKIEKAISIIPDEECRYVIEYRFIHSIKLETIAEYMGYSLSQIKRFYKKGVNMIPNEP